MAGTPYLTRLHQGPEAAQEMASPTGQPRLNLKEPTVGGRPPVTCTPSGHATSLFLKGNQTACLCDSPSHTYINKSNHGKMIPSIY